MLGFPQPMPPLMPGMPMMPGMPYPFGYPITQPMMPGQPAPAPFPMGPPVRSPDLPRIEEELAQVKQVVKVLTQMLVERGALDGEELKRRLRMERERKG
jgi:hypothetical protein